MSYIDESLSQDEKVVALFRPHWFAYLPMLLWLLLNLVTFGLTWLIALHEYLNLRLLEQGVTNMRVIVKRAIESVSNPVD